MSIIVSWKRDKFFKSLVCEDFIKKKAVETKKLLTFFIEHEFSGNFSKRMLTFYGSKIVSAWLNPHI